MKKYFFNTHLHKITKIKYNSVKKFINFKIKVYGVVVNIVTKIIIRKLKGRRILKR